MLCLPKEITSADVERFKEYLSYDTDTGIFTWSKPRKGINVGEIAGSLCNKGYININFNKKKYAAHRLAYAFTHGSCPAELIDHLNGKRSDNRASNLRTVLSVRENMHNTEKTRAGGLVGAWWVEGIKKWRSNIAINRKTHYIGVFATELEAHQAYMKRYHELLEEQKALSGAGKGEDATKD